MSDWEERVVRDGWLPSQNALFVKTVQVLNTDRLARLAVRGAVNEAVQVRLVVDKTAKRLRKLLNGVLWDTKTAQWLHNTLTDVLPRYAPILHLCHKRQCFFGNNKNERKVLPRQWVINLRTFLSGPTFRATSTPFKPWVLIMSFWWHLNSPFFSTI